MDKLIEAVKNAKCVAALTGAGVSTLCGIPDFRGPQGLYKNPDAERIFDIDWFDRDPSVYYRGCRELVYGLGQFTPGPVHTALKHLEDAGHLDGIITQNIDMLHQKAGSSNVYEVHGSPRKHHCRNCGAGATFDEVMAMIGANGGVEKLGEPYVPRCSCGGVYKPDRRGAPGGGFHEVTGTCDQGGRDASPGHFANGISRGGFAASNASARREGVHRERAGNVA